MAGVNGADGGWAQVHGPTLATTTSLFLSIDEDQIGDPERDHVAEQVGYVGVPGAHGLPARVRGRRRLRRRGVLQRIRDLRGRQLPAGDGGRLRRRCQLHGRLLQRGNRRLRQHPEQRPVRQRSVLRRRRDLRRDVGLSGWERRRQIDDGVGCTDDSCDEVSDVVVNTANDANCDNALFCDGAETCDPALACQAGTDPCPGQECDEAGDACVDFTISIDDVWAVEERMPEPLMRSLRSACHRRAARM